MKIYEKGKDFIKIVDNSSFDPEHILECGQVFCYEKKGEDYVVFPSDKMAVISKIENGYLIRTSSPDYFINWFDLNNEYQKIKNQLSPFQMMSEPIRFGGGIRILRQDIFETLISFIISANNNIKRIKMILNNLRRLKGKKVEQGYAFPSRESLFECDEEFFKQAGAGYRAKYLYQVLRQIDEKTLKEWASLDTATLRNKLISLSGVGGKVADCVLLFGFHKGDVFPVDTWIEQMYNLNYPPLSNREKIRNVLVNQFGLLSGYAQQYLFYYQRSFVKK